MTTKDKLQVHYGVKANHFEHKEVDDSQRTVDLIANTYLYFDSDCDVLMPGCAKKSIDERGPGSTTPGKIKHCMDHELSEMIGVPKSITEELFEGKQVLRANSYFPESEDSENALINYKAGMYDQHSIGFRYIQLALATPTGEPDARKLWDEVIGQLINPMDAIEKGFMFVCKELALFEYSTVAFGANRLTPYLGSKSDNKIVRYNNLIAKFDSIKSNVDKYIQDLQERQFKQMLKEIMTEEPFVKPVVIPGNPKANMLSDVEVKSLINNFKF
jgi:hypothetical protein